MPQSRLVKYIPDSVVFKRKPLSEEKNAYGPWLQAAKCLYRPPDDEDVFWSLVFSDPETGEGMDYPTGKAADRVREILDKNRRAFELVDEGIARNRFQIPEQVDFDERNLFFSGIRNIISFCFVNARCLLAEDNYSDAVRASIVLSRIGEIAESSSVPTLPMLILAIPGYKHAIACSKRIVADQNTPSADLQNLMGSLQQQRETIGFFCEGLRNELCYEALNELDRFPDSTDVEEVVDAVLEEYYSKNMLVYTIKENNIEPIVLDSAVQVELEQRLAWRRDKILFLLESHPCPFDKGATAHQMGEQVLAMESEPSGRIGSR